MIPPLDQLPVSTTDDAGATMVRRFGFLGAPIAWLLRRVRLEEHSVEPILAATDRGHVVYVMPRNSELDHLALNVVLNGRRLPLSRWARGIGAGWYLPLLQGLKAGWRRWWHRVDEVSNGTLLGHVEAGRPVVLFLDESHSFMGSGGADAFDAIAQAQNQGVNFLPLMVVWDKGPESPTAIRHFFLGSREQPGWVGRLWQLVWHRREAFVHVGHSIELSTVQDRFEPGRRGQALRKYLTAALRQEAKVVRGPRLLPAPVMKKLVLDTPPMRQLAIDHARQQGTRPDDVQIEMSRQYDRIASRFNWRVIRMLDVLLKPLWTKVFSGVDVRDEDLDRIRAAMRDGTAILIPCHKSHFDYILVTWVLYNHDMIVPHVVAGMNLAVWPLSTILRWCGGFFIERSFGDEPIFPAVFGRYLREMVRQEYPMEFFIEGGRTRSGKLMSPRLGVLGMVLDAAELRQHHREVTLLPIALAYEQVAEEGAYAAELGGQPKRAESFGELLKARSVFKRRFGRVYLRVGEPIACSELVDATEEQPPWSDRPADQRQAELAQLGDRVMHRIGASMVLLPTSLVALALLAHHRRGITDQELRERIHRLHAFLTRTGLPQAASLDSVEHGIAQALDRFVSEGRLRPLEQQGERVWDVPPEQRITLDFYKNQVLHAFVDAGLATAVIRALPDVAFSTTDLVDGVTFLHGLLHREFTWNPDRTVEASVARGLEDLVEHGAIHESEGLYSVADAIRIGEIHSLLRPLLEAYLLIAKRGMEADGKPRDFLVKQMQTETEALLVAGVITRPESASLVTLKNAIGAFTDQGMFIRSEDTLRALPAPLKTCADTLSPMVGQ